jgi:hypothetical protein
MKKFEVMSVNRRGLAGKFEVTQSATKKFEAIIEPLTREDAEQKRYDADMQKIVRINDRTGDVFTGFFNWGVSSSYYLVSNSNLIARALHISPEFIIEDRNGRQIKLHIECEVSCPPGNETKVARALHSTGKSPEIKLNRFIEQCVNRFRNDDEQFINNFFTSNIARQIENFIAGQNEGLNTGKTTHITGLEFHSVKCVRNAPESGTISINVRDFKVNFKESIERHSVIFECNLPVDDKNEINALSRGLTRADFEEVVKKAVQDIFEKFIAEDDVYDRFEAVENTLKTHLDEHFQKYGRRVGALKLRDLDLERIRFLQNIEIGVKERKFLALDRKYVEIREILLTASIKNLRAVKRHKDNQEWLKNKLKEKVEDAISEFISKIDSGEFYSKIEKPNTDFRELFVQSVVSKTAQIIDADIILKKIDTGTELENDKIDEIRKGWTSFTAHIVSQLKGECSVQGSFIVTDDDPTKRAMRGVQEFDTENIKNKIVETLEAWLVRYSAATIISANLQEPQNFEKAIKRLLLDKVVEAHGVIINIQNIKTEIVNQSATGTKIGVAKGELEEELLKALKEGRIERADEVKKRLKGIEDYENEYKESLGQVVSSSNHASGTPGSEEVNSLLKEVKQLLLEETTSSN